jgi:hypothetical protein
MPGAAAAFTWVLWQVLSRLHSVTDSQMLSLRRSNVGGHLMSTKLNEREHRALAHALFHVADVFPRGIGLGTVAGLVERGLLRRDTCPKYGTVGYKTTDAGSLLANQKLAARPSR